MDALNPLCISALKELKKAKTRLTTQQYRTIKGQILAGYPVGAMKGLQKIINRTR